MIDWLPRSLVAGSSGDPQVEVDGRLLPVAIRRHARSKRLTMRLAPDGSEVRVTMPAWGRTREAVDFAASRREWLAAQLARVPQATPVAPGTKLPYRGIDLLVDWQAKAPRRPAKIGERLVLGGPQDSLQLRLRRWLEGEALALMGADLAFYCHRAGSPLPDLRLSRAGRRWGSCSGERPGAGRSIRINWRLVMAPDHVRRSVVAHEVAHLTHFDHSPRFHALLAAIFENDVAEADGWLKAQGRQLYAPFG